MLAEASRRLQLVTSPEEGSPGLFIDDLETESHSIRPLSGWDEVAARWPEGGRFPSFIVIDQTT